MLVKHKHTNIPTMMEPFAPPMAWDLLILLIVRADPLPKGPGRGSWKGFSRINKLNEKIIYFYCLSIITIIARPPSAMLAKTAFIAVGGPP